MIGLCFTWVRFLLLGSHVCFGGSLCKHFCERHWRMILVNSSPAVVACVPYKKYHRWHKTKCLCSFPAPRSHGLAPGPASERARPQPHVWCEQWPGGVHGPLASRLLWARAELWPVPSLHILGFALLPWFCWHHFYFIFFILFSIFYAQSNNQL